MTTRILLLLQEICLDLLGKLRIVQNPAPNNGHTRRATHCSFIRLQRSCPCCELRGVVDAIGRDGENAVESWNDI